MSVFNNGTIEEYVANIIASNIYEEGDADGFLSLLLYQIVDHKSSGEAIKLYDKYITARTGTRRMRQTTVGWLFLIQWGDGSWQQFDLKLLKESNPVQVGQYVIARGIEHEPAFAWWVPYVMQKGNYIVSAVKLRMRRTTHKYGIEMPEPGKNIVQNSIDLDRQNGNTFWKDALAKEMGTLMIAFEILEPGQKNPPGWHITTGHIIVNVKMDFTRKA